MDFVTITDHNTITGALEIAHLPGAFVSVEITSYFPEDGCKVHIVALDISETQFRDIQSLRRNIYDLVSYLNRSGIIHFIAHPFYDQNNKLTTDHLEKILLLFKVFEVKNGTRSRRFGGFLENVLTSLSPHRLAQLADRHNMAPVGDTPWCKASVGGSDDHGGLFIAGAHTVVPGASSLAEFLDGITSGTAHAAGSDGDSLTLAHSLYAIGHSFYRQKLGQGSASSMPFINALLQRFFQNGTERSSFLDKLKLFIRKTIPELHDRSTNGTFEELLDREAKQLLKNRHFLQSIKTESRNRKIFTVTSYLANRMLYHYSKRLTSLSLNSGFFDVVNTVSTMAVVHLLIAPYYLAFNHQHRGKNLMADLARRLDLPGHDRRPEKIALFTDTLDEINGVAITIRRLIGSARDRGVELTVITSSPKPTGFADGVMNFQCIGDFTLPEYPDLKLHFPPILDVIEYFEREEFTRIHVSTPGSVGLLALLIAKLLDVPIAGTYHTDIPQYVRSLTSDEMLEHAAWNFMIWFYGQLAEVMVPSASTRTQLIQRGLAEEKTRPLPRWVDVQHFSPERRNPALWCGVGLVRPVTFLYVGRISKEKNLQLLADVFPKLSAGTIPVQLVMVGDGPYRAELEQHLQGTSAVFTGFLGGDDLAAAYASADVFVFPSSTDTFGNVVLEAQASGLPVIVSDGGGPKELMLDGITGLVVPAGCSDALLTAMTRLLNDRDEREAMACNARKFTEQGAEHIGDLCSALLQPHAANY